MPTSFMVMELSAFMFAACLIFHAIGEGRRWLATLLWGMVFGTVIELLLLQGGSYHYGKFLIMIGPEGKQVPLWVGVGWGQIVYAASWTAQRLHQPPALRAATAGVLAVNIDLSLDPIAEMYGFWNWVQQGDVTFYGVPFDNFLGWFAIVGFFSFSVRALFRKIPPGRPWVDFLIPGIGAALATAAMFLAGKVIPFIYEIAGGQLLPFLVILGVSMAAMWHAAFRGRRDLPPALPVIALPIFFHTLFFLFFLASDAPSSDALVSLAVLIPQNLVVGFFAYSWVSIAVLFAIKAESGELAAESLVTESRKI